MGFVLFALASLLGLGIGIAITTAVIRTSLRLVEAVGKLDLVFERRDYHLGQVPYPFK